MKLNRWMVIAALLSAQAGYVLAEAQNDELGRLKQQLQELDQKVRILERNKELETEVADAKAKTLPTVNLGASGLNVSTADSNFVLRIRGYVQADSRTFLDDHPDLKGNDSFLLRRVRPIIEGTVAKDFDYRIMLDFASGVTSGTGNNGFLQDGYVNYKRFSGAQLQVGKFKEPVGLERLQSGANLLFIERGLPTQLVPNRDVGIQVHGKFWGNTLGYQLGYFNGVEDGGSGDIETTDDGKDIAARVFTHPFDQTDIEPLKKLGLGIAVTHGQHEGAPRNYSAAGQQAWYRWRTGAGTNGASANVTSDDNTTRIAPQGYYYWGPFGVFGEYVISSRDAVSAAGTASRRERLDNHAWQVAASFFLTGEENSFGPVTPLRPFVWGGGGWGAWELVARIGQLTVDDEAFTDGNGDGRPDFASDNAPERVTEWGVGLNWHLNRNLK
ncbi:MAG TPA: porin, partial [Candidatus Acidoferrum sp.]|nr:porin [Candidatus Acidoferrum sp.]